MDNKDKIEELEKQLLDKWIAEKKKKLKTILAEVGEHEDEVSPNGMYVPGYLSNIDLLRKLFGTLIPNDTPEDWDNIDRILQVERNHILHLGDVLREKQQLYYEREYYKEQVEKLRRENGRLKSTSNN